MAQFTSKNTFGWDAKGPYRKAGSALIPENHSLRFSFENRHVVVYSDSGFAVQAAILSA